MSTTTKRKILSRKNKASTKTLEIILSAIGDGLTQRDAATLAGISEDTLSLWKRQDSDFSEQIRQKEIEHKRSHILNIKKASEKSWQASAWWLERRHRIEFGRENTELEDRKIQHLDQTGTMIKAILEGTFKQGRSPKLSREVSFLACEEVAH